MSKIHFCLTVVGNVKDWAELSRFNIPYTSMMALKEKGEIEVIQKDLVIKVSAREFKGDNNGSTGSNEQS